MKLTSKYILWIEDFAGDTFIDPSDQDSKIDRSPCIKDNFPSEFVDYVEVLEDPTLLPEHLEEYAANYKLIVLDINFENGLSPKLADHEKLICAFKKARITEYEHSIPDSNIKELGYDIFTYLSREYYKARDIVLFSAYINSEEEDKIRERLKEKEIPQFYNKNNLNDFQSFIKSHLSEMSSSEYLHFIKAKECFLYWTKKEIANDSIFAMFSPKIKIDNQQKMTEESIKYYKYNIIEQLSSDFSADFKPKSDLDLPESSDSLDDSCQNPYYNILWNVFCLFDEVPDNKKIYKSNYSEQQLCQKKNLYDIMKYTRNKLAHDKSDPTTPREFLILFCLGMRILFESQSTVEKDLILSEKWLFNPINQRKKTSISMVEDQIVRHEPTLLKWYYNEFIKWSKKVVPLSDRFRQKNSEKKPDYTFNHIIHLFCFRALGINKVKISYSSRSNNPCLQLTFGQHDPVPHPAIEQIALSIIKSESESNTLCNDNLSLPL